MPITLQMRVKHPIRWEDYALRVIFIGENGYMSSLGLASKLFVLGRNYFTTGDDRNVHHNAFLVNLPQNNIGIIVDIDEYPGRVFQLKIEEEQYPWKSPVEH